MFKKFAKVEVLGVKSSATRQATASLSKFADYEDYRTDDGYIYVRVRAISSRVNKNNDGWPSSELADSYKTFIGKPIFVDHHNSDPTKARGVIVDAALHVEDEKTSKLDPYYATAPANHKPPTWIELLLEVDAKKFPKLARAIISEDIDSVSMGANVELSKCSHCGNEATSPEEYCSHVRSKGAYFDYTESDGTKTSKKAYEDCYKIGFFEISFVFDPADETALVSEIKKKSQRIAAIHAEADDDFGDFMASMQKGSPYPKNDDEVDHSAPGHDIPAKVNEIYNAVKRENPDYSKEKAMAIAWSRSGEKHEGANEYGDFERTSFKENADPDQIFNMYVGDIMDNLGIRWRNNPGVYKAVHDSVLASSRGRVPDYGQYDFNRQKSRRYMWGVAQAAKAIQANPQIMQLVNQGQIPNYDARQDFYDQTQNGVRGIVDPADSAWNRPAPQTPASIMASNEYGNFDAYGDFVRTAEVGAQGSPPPQSEMLSAPTAVNTLRQEQICPICGSNMEDGVCEVCNYEEPPEGFDNPDLAHAKEVNEQIHQQDAQEAAQGQGQQPSDVQPAPGQGPQPLPGGMQPATSNVSGSGTVRIEDKTSAQQGRINTQERPILPATRKLTDKPIGQKTISEAKKPVQSNQTKETMTDTVKTADGASALGTGVAPDSRVDVLGVGGVSGDPLSGIEHENVEKDTGDFTAPATKTWSGNDGDSLGQQDAVTSETGDFFTVSKQTTADTSGDLGGPFGVAVGEGTSDKGGPTWDTPASGFPDHQPARVDLLAPLKEEVGEGTKTFQGDSFHITEPVTKGQNGNELGGPIGTAIASTARSSVMKALKLAETEIDLGIASADNKFARLAELEGESDAVIEAKLAALTSVKTAGLAKQTATPKTAGAGRMPSLAPTSEPTAHMASYDIEMTSVDDEDVKDSLW